MKHTKHPLPTLLESTEALFRAGACIPNANLLDQARWHEQAVELSSQTNPQELSDAAFGLLGQVPLKTAVDVVHGIRHGRANSETLQWLTMFRKDCYVVRDAMILTSENSPRRKAAPLYDTCRYLGFIADSGGKFGKGETLNALHHLNKKQLTPQPLHTQEGLAVAVRDRLDSATLLMQNPAETQETITYDTYHDARKDFRRVLAVGVLGVAALGLGEYYDFAVEGVALSIWHGQIKDVLCAREQPAAIPTLAAV
jgi:hypothetical protein